LANFQNFGKFGRRFFRFSQTRNEEMNASKIFALLSLLAASAEAFNAPVYGRVDRCRARVSPPDAAIWDRLLRRRPVPIPDVPAASSGEPVAVATPAATQTTTLRAAPDIPATGAGESDSAPATGVGRTTLLLADTAAYNAKIAQAEAENRVSASRSPTPGHRNSSRSTTLVSHHPGGGHQVLRVLVPRLQGAGAQVCQGGPGLAGARVLRDAL